MNLSKKEVQEKIKHIREHFDAGSIFQKKREEIEELRALAQPLSELVKEMYFTVDRIIDESYSRDVPAISEPIFYGQPGFVPSARETITLYNLEVTPIEKDNVIKVLTFDNYTPIRPGDTILAKVPLVNVKNTRDIISFDEAESLYFPRAALEKEMAIEVAIVDAEKNILRNDRAKDYSNYV